MVHPNLRNSIELPNKVSTFQTTFSIPIAHPKKVGLLIMDKILTIFSFSSSNYVSMDVFVLVHIRYDTFVDA